MSELGKKTDSHRRITVLVVVAVMMWILLALAAGLLALYAWPSVAQELFLSQAAERQGPLPNAVPPKATVAVVPFANDSPGEADYEWLGYAFAYGTVSRLATFNELVIAGPEEIRKELANEQSELTLSDITSLAAAREAGEAVHAEYVLIGNCAKSGDEMRVTAQIVEVATGNIHSERAGVREYANIFDAYAELALWTAEALDLTTYPARLERIKYKPTQSIPAYECFGQGVTHYYRGEYEEAAAACHKAVDIDSNFADAYVVLAWALGCQEKYEEAITQLKKVGKLDADRPYLHYYLGIAYRENEHYDEAVDELRQAVERKPQDIKVWCALGAAYLASADNHYYNFYGYHDLDESYPAMADCRRAKDVFSQVLRLDPTRAEAYEQRAQAYYGMCDYHAAIADCNRAIEINPHLAGAYLTRGDACDEIGDVDKALADCNYSLSVEPSAAAYRLRAYMYMRKKDYDQAIADYTRSLELDPEHCMSWNNRASTYIDIGEYDLAISDATRGLELDPNHVKLIVNRAQAYFEKGNWDRAIPDLTRSIALDPVNRCWAYRNRAEAHFEKEDYQHALADLDRYLEECTEQESNKWYVAASWANRGSVRRALGDYDEALADVNQALAMRPNLGCAYAIRAHIYYDLGDYQQAWADTRTALEKSPKCSGGYSMQGRLHAHDGNYQDAITDYKRALEYEDPWEHPDTYYKMAVVYKDMGELSLAREYAQKTLEQLPEHKEAQELLAELEELAQ